MQTRAQPPAGRPRIVTYVEKLFARAAEPCDIADDERLPR